MKTIINYITEKFKINSKSIQINKEKENLTMKDFIKEISKMFGLSFDKAENFVLGFGTDIDPKNYTYQYIEYDNSDYKSIVNIGGDIINHPSKFRNQRIGKIDNDDTELFAYLIKGLTDSFIILGDHLNFKFYVYLLNEINK